ncbi:nicotinamide riboside transporter PnuC [Sphingomonas sp. RIT328]|uniref:nicotinamide riboside transporter PnuC n=1 Tax=Sphingomonas sp. RIT328 TaxID=1470591 RepID=UPI00044C90C7|nr:nicotinamide riboside transporter PnuC [Sphingomonas sp. RIT328]EZP57310.1 Nicotinamide mononucleotide transporter PnuC [Sphingomonas sp. RIT328]
MVEALAAALVIVNVALVARRSVWNYPVALVAVAIYAWVFATARLYSDALLQGVFFAANLYGWRNWAHSRATAGTVIVTRLAPVARIGWLVAIVAVAWGWGLLMHRFTDAAYPWWDAALAIASVAAQWLQARRAIESWWLWIAVDVGSVPLYAAKALWITAALYAVLLGLAIWGWIDWRRAAVRQEGKVRA